MTATPSFQRSNKSCLFALRCALLVALSILSPASGNNINDDDIVYCLDNTPAIGWPSTSLPNIQQVDLVATMTITPVNKNRILLAVRTPQSDYQRATLRIDWPGSFPTGPFIQNEDCGNLAAGMSNRQGNTLIGMLQVDTPVPFATESVELDVTIVLERGLDMWGETEITYAFEHVVVEPWMWKSQDTTLTADGWAVTMLPNGSLQLDLASRAMVNTPVRQQPQQQQPQAMVAQQQRPTNPWGPSWKNSPVDEVVVQGAPLPTTTTQDTTSVNRSGQQQWDMAVSPSWITTPSTTASAATEETSSSWSNGSYRFVTQAEGLASSAGRTQTGLLAVLMLAALS